MTQAQVHKRSADQKHDAYEEPVHEPDRESERALKDKLDELLDEVDGLLEDETFAATYVQRGGE